MRLLCNILQRVILVFFILFFFLFLPYKILGQIYISIGWDVDPNTNLDKLFYKII